MNVVLPTCRDRITGEDVDFIASVLCRNREDVRFLAELLADPASRDAILDNVKLVGALQDDVRCLKISCYLYFYLLVRHGLLHDGLNDLEMADYVGEMLAEFSEIHRLDLCLPHGEAVADYAVDMLEALRECPTRDKLAARMHIGNLFLFITGLYPQKLFHRQATHGAPGLDYYEAVGRASYEEASHLRAADDLALSALLHKLGEYFHPIRCSLNHIRERLIFVEPLDVCLLEGAA